MNTKDIIVVSKGALAIAVDAQGVVTKVAGASAFDATMKVVNSLVEQVATEYQDVVTSIYVPDLVQGIVSGSALAYLRDGKTISGTALTGDEIKLFMDFYSLYGARAVNVKLGQVRYIAKENAGLQQLKNSAWNALEAELKGAINLGGTTVDPDKALREAFDNKIIEALTAGDVEKVKELKALRDELRAPVTTGGYNHQLHKPLNVVDSHEEVIIGADGTVRTETVEGAGEKVSDEVLKSFGMPF